MRVVILDDPQQVSQRAADMICSTVSSNSNAVLGLATGSTPLETYRELVQRHAAGQVSFAGVTTFNLDEYVGLGADHPQSYHRFMHANLFDLADFNRERCYLPNGLASCFPEECGRYETLLEQAGGIDLQLLGLGADGHIAFNEPGSSLGSGTRVKTLSMRTVKDNARFFGSEEAVPKLAITMGVGTILSAKHIVLLAIGGHKASAVRAMVEGPVTAQNPASALQLHPRVTVLLDREAAEWLVRKDYYRHVETLQRELELAGSNVI